MNYYGLLVAFFYGGMSVASVFINKAIFHVYKFNHPYTLVLGQTVFTIVLLFFMQQFRIVRLAPFQLYVFQRVFVLSFSFLLKLLLDMSALNRVNIPMYGVLKSFTTPFVLAMDYVLRDKSASTRIQMAVYMTALGGVIAGIGDLTFDLAGYVLALSSALATAAYVVLVGKLGDDLQLDSFTLLLYNSLWSLPASFTLVVLNGEMPAVASVLGSKDMMFLSCFIVSCASAFILNLATYLCTLVNDSLTTSVVGRTKSILQGIGGLFAFGDVKIGLMNLMGLLVNSCGIGWYSYEKYLEAKRKILLQHHYGGGAGVERGASVKLSSSPSTTDSEAAEKEGLLQSKSSSMQYSSPAHLLHPKHQKNAHLLHQTHGVLSPTRDDGHLRGQGQGMGRVGGSIINAEEMHISRDGSQVSLVFAYDSADKGDSLNGQLNGKV